MKKVLVTGGAGYIGSSICYALADKGFIPVVLDSLVQGEKSFIDQFPFYHRDIGDKDVIKEILEKEGPIDSCIHCAARIIVPESVECPDLYYNENVSKSLKLFKELIDNNFKKIIFSSSASIYDASLNTSVTEKSPKNPLSPYARTKYMTEMILEDLAKRYQISGVSLRYFNPIGADPQMRCGAYAKDPSHVLGKLVSVYLKKQKTFYITGTKWPTRDGSGLRDYVHVRDLATAHISALETVTEPGFSPLNLGTSHGVTVYELIQAFEKVIGSQIPIEETDPRPGDVAGCVPQISLSQKILNWTPEYNLETGIRHSLEWAAKWFPEEDNLLFS